MKRKRGSSAAAESKLHQYDVFINHRGPDVRKTFVAHLDAALRRDGFQPFLDGKDIEHGRHIFTAIDKVVKGACVHVAIFSKRYAESKYCLNELCDMLRSEQVILPVFYHVNPLDLRGIENGPFKEGFDKHAQRERTEEILKWKDALCKIADYKGFRLDEVNGTSTTACRCQYKQVDDGLICCFDLQQRRAADLEHQARRSSTVDADGCATSETTIWYCEVLEGCTEDTGVCERFRVGVGGIGKTTLAMKIYNYLLSRRQFERYCFLKDVRSSDRFQLQQNLLKDLGYHSEQQNISAQNYKHMLDALICKNVLIIVDDVDHSRQFAALIPDIQKLGYCSRIVITSRQADILRNAIVGAPSKAVYDVPLLNKIDSQHVFNSHAFLRETPSEGYADLTRKLQTLVVDMHCRWKLLVLRCLTRRTQRIGRSG